MYTNNDLLQRKAEEKTPFTKKTKSYIQEQI